MSETEWLTCTDPKPMLDSLQDKASDRKLRLFGCACCRRAWDSMRGARSKNAVETAEAYADGRATGAELSAAAEAATPRRLDIIDPADLDWGAPDCKQKHNALVFAPLAAAMATVRDGPDGMRIGVMFIAKDAAKAVGPGEMDMQARLIRDIFDNPFRPLSPIDASLLTWNNAAIPKLALAAYEERQMPSGILDPVRLLALADALQAAGCKDAELLGHLRSPGPHVRGCWALDALWGKS